MKRHAKSPTFRKYTGCGCLVSCLHEILDMSHCRVNATLICASACTKSPTMLSEKVKTWSIGCLGLVFGGGEVKNETRAQERAALVVCALLWVLMASVRDVAGGDAFGARRLCGLTPLVAWGTLGVLKRAKNAGALAYGSTVAACLVCAGFNLVRVWSAIAGSLDLRA